MNDLINRYNLNHLDFIKIKIIVKAKNNFFVNSF